MQLFLHIGTEKTASSFLQTVAAQNRAWLKDHGIYFPLAGKSEKMMQAGKISPGNGRDLYEALQRARYDEVFALLKNYRTAAGSHDCENLLVSNESLLEPLSDPVIAENFLALLQKAGLQPAPFLLMLREPADQALSLYKHRAKSGTLNSLDQWLKEGYHLPLHLQGLFAWVDKDGPGLYLTRYRQDSAWLVQEFFQTWLGLDAAPVWKETSVNPSLTLSELVLIRQMRQTRPGWVSFLYDALLEIPKAHKSDDRYLKADCMGVISVYLSQFQNIWQAANRRLPETDQFALPCRPEKNTGGNATLSFTPEQLRSLTEFWLHTRNPLFLIHVFWRQHLRPMLAHVKWGLINFLRNMICDYQ